jgi:hypothetical protein
MGLVAYTDGSPFVSISAASLNVLPQDPIPLPTSDAAYFNQVPSVIVQLIDSDGLCLMSEFPASSTTANTSRQFVARIP